MASFVVAARWSLRANAPEELSFEESEEMILVNVENDDWYRVQNFAGKIGMVPRSYFTPPRVLSASVLVPVAVAAAAPAAPAATGQVTFEALGDYSAVSAEELSLRLGDLVLADAEVNLQDQDWVWVQSATSSATGYVPSSYLKQAAPGPAAATATATATTSQAPAHSAATPPTRGGIYGTPLREAGPSGIASARGPGPGSSKFSPPPASFFPPPAAAGMGSAAGPGTRSLDSLPVASPRAAPTPAPATASRAGQFAMPPARSSSTTPAGGHHAAPPPPAPFTPMTSRSPTPSGSVASARAAFAGPPAGATPGFAPPPTKSAFAPAPPPVVPSRTAAFTPPPSTFSSPVPPGRSPSPPPAGNLAAARAGPPPPLPARGNAAAAAAAAAAAQPPAIARTLSAPAPAKAPLPPSHTPAAAAAPAASATGSTGDLSDRSARGRQPSTIPIPAKARCIRHERQADSRTVFFVCELTFNGGLPPRFIWRSHQNFLDFQVSLLALFPAQAVARGSFRPIPYLPGHRLLVSESTHVKRRAEIDTYLTEFFEPARLPAELLGCALVGDFFMAREIDLKNDPQLATTTIGGPGAGGISSRSALDLPSGSPTLLPERRPPASAPVTPRPPPPPAAGGIASPRAGGPPPPAGAAPVLVKISHPSLGEAVFVTLRIAPAGVGLGELRRLAAAKLTAANGTRPGASAPLRAVDIQFEGFTPGAGAGSSDLTSCGNLQSDSQLGRLLASAANSPSRTVYLEVLSNA
ncbi:hypothetical protein H696_03309 [Fonticula alba]|uniref:SH3 domain-containing protein n=1 Tax=Fonticula alba TaxID=691883 RepID=A0A058Z6T4_FONAL|nr:hypothetical protein H696_03309 [Fonticula alba]KCV69836.1 hypothetical protein H696_03309 [Fonticula alba]|eukprot:XP_009495442.1 hypothetical protein H696_03309 [Fonticula alba]